MKAVHLAIGGLSSASATSGLVRGAFRGRRRISVIVRKREQP
jgi:hypothetical protein